MLFSVCGITALIPFAVKVSMSSQGHSSWSICSLCSWITAVILVISSQSEKSARIIVQKSLSPYYSSESPASSCCIRSQSHNPQNSSALMMVRSNLLNHRKPARVASPTLIDMDTHHARPTTQKKREMMMMRREAARCSPSEFLCNAIQLDLVL